jgi:hypothetical protein
MINRLNFVVVAFYYVSKVLISNTFSPNNYFATMISQNLFDETLLENQDVFEYTDEEAVKETIDEFVQQQSQAPQHANAHHRLEHLSLTHPSSPQGKKDREMLKSFEENLKTNSRNNIAAATSMLRELQQVQSTDKQQRNDKENGIADEEDGSSSSSSNNSNSNSCIIMYRTKLLSLWFLMLQNNLWTKLAEQFDANDDVSKFIPLIDFVGALFPDSSLSLHPLARDLKRAIAPFWFDPQQKKKNTMNEGNNDDHIDVDVDATTTANIWYRLFEDSIAIANHNEFSFSLAQLARNLCNGCEDNKKYFVKGSLVRCHISDNKSGLELLVETLGNVDEGGEPSSSFALVREICRLIAVLSKFQPLAEPNDSSSTPEAPTTGGIPLVSSAHANVKEFHRTGAVTRLHRIAKECLLEIQQKHDDDDSNENRNNQMTASQLQDLLCDSLAALRTMAIDNDIVQNMIALGMLDTVRDGLQVAGRVVTTQNESSSPSISGLTTTLSLATATMGLVRNLCANDEVKTTICKSSLPSILQVMQQYLNEDESVQGSSSSRQDVKPHSSRRTKSHAILQEHACGILAAMALRQPQNAHAIVEAGGHVLIFGAMRAFPDKVTLQRQGCLAVRNIASRLARMNYEEDKIKLLDAGAEDILQNIAGKHPASSEEAYAALRDLGCNPKMFQLDEYGNATRSISEAFGSVKSNFRPVYE